MTPRRVTPLVAAFVALATAVACGGGGDDAESTTPPSTAAPATTEPATTPAPPTTEEPTTTTEESTTTTTEAPTTTAAPTTTLPAEPARMPLTGAPLAFGQLAPDRAALVVKIDNVGTGRNQSGLNQADVVFEEIVEGNATRFAAVFHSQGANPVGPIRSGRTQDVDLLSGLNQPLFVWSGGNGRVVDAINASALVSVNATSGGCCFYRSGRARPHNLYNNTDAVWEAYAGVATGRPAAVFSYVRPDVAVPGGPAGAAELRMGHNPVRWEWSPESGTYLRRQNGAAHQLDGGQATADNVVILEVGYRPSPADARSPEAITVGSGRVWVLSDGTVQSGGWSRADNLAPFQLVADDGSPILLGPGRTWVELSRAGDNQVQVG